MIRLLFLVLLVLLPVAAGIFCYEARRHLRDAREQERRRPGSVPPQELEDVRRRASLGTLALLTALALITAFLVLTRRLMATLTHM